MVVVSMVVVILVVVKVIAWDAAIVNMVVVAEVLVIDVLVGMEVIVVAIVLKFFSPISYSLGVPSDAAVDLSIDASADAILGILSEVIGIEVLADVNANAFAVATALKFPVLTTLEEFSR